MFELTVLELDATTDKHLSPNKPLPKRKPKHQTPAPLRALLDLPDLEMRGMAQVSSDKKAEALSSQTGGFWPQMIGRAPQPRVCRRR
jgi:hypothetical protein